jgi:hypothetical protein
MGERIEVRGVETIIATKVGPSYRLRGLNARRICLDTERLKGYIINVVTMKSTF